MATQRTSFSKIERARTKQAKAAAKRQRRADRSEVGDLEAAAASPGSPASPGGLSTAEVLQQVEDIHQQFEASVIDFETFELRKSELLSQLTVD
jgi:hypothetical protein